MKRGSTLFLRGSILLIGLVVLALCVVILPTGVNTDSNGYGPIVIGMYATTIPFYFALYQGLNLLGYIDTNKAFSNASVQALSYIKYCAGIICGFYAAGMPYIYLVADKDDAPGVIVLGLVVVFASFVIATFAALLQRLLQSAAALKSENELTI